MGQPRLQWCGQRHLVSARSVPQRRRPRARQPPQPPVSVEGLVAPAFVLIGCGRTELGVTRQFRSEAPSIQAPQLCAIGYLAKITPILFSAFSAAACGVIPSLMTSASAAPQTCWEFASA
jgi:hypothetical protein